VAVVGQIIVADVDQERTAELLEPDRRALGRLIRKEGEAAAVAA
jgi:isocitrate lyase